MKFFIAALFLAVSAGISSGEEDQKTLDEIRKELANQKAEFLRLSEEGEKQKTELQRQKTELHEQKTENKQQKVEVENLRKEAERQKSEIYQQRMEIDKEKIENDNQRTENAKQRTQNDKLKLELDEQKMKLEDLQEKSSKKKIAKRQDGETAAKVGGRQDDMDKLARTICVEEIRKYHREHNDTVELKKIIRSEIQKLRPGKLVKITDEGTAGSTYVASGDGGRLAKYAFQNTAKYWGGGSGADKYPQYLWFRFHTPHILARIGLTATRNFVGPKHFQVVGSNDCVNWTELLDVTNSGYPNDGEPGIFRSWEIPENRRISYPCIGLKIINTPCYPGCYPEIKNIIMWEEAV